MTYLVKFMVALGGCVLLAATGRMDEAEPQSDKLASHRIVVPPGGTLPNILVLIADDAGWKDFGCYGHPTIRTPNIDQLAKNGLLFRNAFLTTSSCSPSRTSILSGQYAHTIGTEDMHVPLPKGVPLLPTYLKKEGYFTGHTLKTHYGPNGENQFDWYGKKLADFEDFLNKTDDKPFFFWTGFNEPHRPYDTKDYKNPFHPEKAVVPPTLVDDGATRQDLADYYSEIERMDGEIGQMIAQLKARNKLNNTLIIFLSDNGAPFPRAKGTVYDSGIGTPLIFSWPEGILKDKTYEPLVSSIDLAPTILQLAGIEKPAAMPGVDLQTIFTNQKAPVRDYVFSERNWHGIDEHIRSVRTDRYKLIVNGAYAQLPFGSPSDIAESPSWQSLYRHREAGTLMPPQKLLFNHPRARLELYDLRKDPYELKNIADEPGQKMRVKELTAILAQWNSETKDVQPTDHIIADKTDRFTGQPLTRN